MVSETGACLSARTESTRLISKTLKAAQTRGGIKLSAKLRGGYYTPTPISDLLCSWAVKKKNDTVLEPSCGDGVFIEAAAKRLIRLNASSSQIGRQLCGVELVSQEATKTRARISRLCGNQKAITCADFFEWSQKNSGKRFDCVLGNPPFIRYQNFPATSRGIAMEMLHDLGFRPNQLTNMWVPFVARAVYHLKPGGRLAMVIPAELLQVSYAAQLRDFLTREFDALNLVACNEMIFADAQQEIILLCAEGRVATARSSHQCRINLSEARLDNLKLRNSQLSFTTKEAKIIHHDSEKWLKYFLTNAEIHLMRELRTTSEVGTLSNHASIDVGVVTGKNDFFVLSKADIERLGIQQYAFPLVGRSNQLRGAMLERCELDELAATGHKVFLFYVPSHVNGSLSPAAKKYVADGENLNMHEGYKCSIREPWYSVPSVWKPDCFFYRQIYDFPKVVINRAAATSTDTIHRMHCRDGSDVQTVVRTFYTHLTAASAEIEGRSYGGGVLELEPTEAERLLFPMKLFPVGIEIERIDQLLRAGKLAQVLAENDTNVLRKGLGLSRTDCLRLREIWIKMRDRRQARRKRFVST